MQLRLRYSGIHYSTLVCITAVKVYSMLKNLFNVVSHTFKIDRCYFALNAFDMHLKFLFITLLMASVDAARRLYSVAHPFLDERDFCSTIGQSVFYWYMIR